VITTLSAFLLAQPASAATNNIVTVAGTPGGRAASGDGGLATAAQIGLPHGIAVEPDGSYLIADTLNNRIRRVSTAGTITTVAGTGMPGSAGDGGPATAAQLSSPESVAAMSDGGFLIADTDNNRIRRVSPDGTITTVAGTGDFGGPGPSGDGGPAAAAQLTEPFAVAVTADGGFLIADSGDVRIRRVSPAGTITTVAGTGAEGFSGDGGPATAATLGTPEGVAETADGGFLVADSGNEVIRRVSPDGTITTVAGNGGFGFSGDGGAATAAELQDPVGVTEAADGSVLIADVGSGRVRRVLPDGTITTLAGTDGLGFSGDGGPATAAQLNLPSGVAVTASGGVLVADSANNVVRLVDAGLPVLGGLPGPIAPPGPPAPPAPSGPPAPIGAPGPAAPPAPIGAPSPSGPVSPAHPARFAAAFVGRSLRARPHARVIVRFTVSRAARVRVTISGSDTRPVRVSKLVRSGRVAVTVRAPARRGRYRLVLMATTGDGMRASDTARIVVG
jgi:hypothetical protein